MRPVGGGPRSDVDGGETARHAEAADKFIEDNGMILVLSHADTGLCLWEDVGGHVWTRQNIVEAIALGILQK